MGLEIGFRVLGSGFRGWVAGFRIAYDKTRSPTLKTDTRISGTA